MLCICKYTPIIWACMYIYITYLYIDTVRDVCTWIMLCHDDVIKWKYFPRYWPFVRGIHRSPANSPHKGQWRGALMFSLICVWIHGWVNNGEAGDLRCNRAHYDVTVMVVFCCGLVAVDFTHIRQGYFTGIGAIQWLPLWSNPERYE